MMKAFQYLEFLFQDTGPFKLKVLDKVLSLAIPFNRPHNFKIKKIESAEVQIEVPCRRVNLNHLNGVHACAMATVGEYSAGLLILKNFTPQKYRIILSHLEADYTYQGKTHLLATAQMTQEMRHGAEQELSEKGQTLIHMVTQLKDKKNNDVAQVKSTWQIKPWSQVKTKL